MATFFVPTTETVYTTTLYLDRKIMTNTEPVSERMIAEATELSRS